MDGTLIIIGMLLGLGGFILLLVSCRDEKLPGDPVMSLFLHFSYLMILVMIAQSLREGWAGSRKIRWGWAIVFLGGLLFAAGIVLQD
jgi:hypothetical protein